MKKTGVFLLCFLTLSLLIPLKTPASSDSDQYMARFHSINTLTEAKAAGYEPVGIITDYFPTACVHAECTVYPSINRQYGRMALFFADADGRVLYKTEDLACNNFYSGQLTQPNADVAAISERDVNGDGLKDILIINLCLDDDGVFKIGDILYQGADMFYRDWRVTDKINRFNMNKDIDMMTAFARDGQSAEFLYSAATLDELIRDGFIPLTDQTFDADFEKFGAVKVVPGTYTMGGIHIFILYLVNSDGLVVWNFQCMRGYDSFNRMTGISFKDVDGDGWADLSVLAVYDSLGDNDETQTVTDFSIYYQRDGYFFEDTDFRAAFLKQLTGKETMDDIVQAARKYWGW